jgi:outer membrane immunogenic protein
MKKFATVAAAIAALGFVNAASAADMPVKAPMAAPIAAPVYNWTGFYIGGVVGYGSATGQHCDANTCAISGFTYPQTDPKGWNGGITLGYNWQIARWVLGLEGDWSWGNMKGTSGVSRFDCGSATGGCVTTIKSYETLRGRVGYAFDRFLPYVTAGAAWTQLNASINPPAPLSGSTTKTSFVVGGGLEYAFWQNWSAKVEYLYISKLGDFLYDPNYCSAPGCFARTSAINEVRFGLNYRFTGL